MDVGSSSLEEWDVFITGRPCVGFHPHTVSIISMASCLHAITQQYVSAMTQFYTALALNSGKQWYIHDFTHQFFLNPSCMYYLSLANV